MREYNGAGLAAPQVHVLQQICVIEVSAIPATPTRQHSAHRADQPGRDADHREMDDGWEGCLSVPDMRGVVPRYTAVRIEA